MNKTAKRGKNKGRNALYLSKWCYTTSHNQRAAKRKIKPLAGGKIK
jgi:hypothetical protein